MTTRRTLLILHAHLPYVPLSQPEALEERWFFEALCETYLPLLACFAANDALRAALSLSPPLLGMLGERPRLERCRRLISRRIALAERERARVTSAFAHLPDYYAARDRALLAQLDQYDDDLLGAFAALARAGRLELFTTAGTHPFLPYLGSRHWQRVHVELACDAFAQAFGQAPRGVWLPECAYEPGLDTVLAACGVAWSVVDGPAFARAR
ncbi:MAG TPA: DUF1957 domain-containing protein, partial [Limnochordia bacterium]|nr:DUF1957 domain-containing protein [Limnochordia bacterium]